MVLRRYSYEDNMRKYYPNRPSVEFQRFSEEYFTGADVRIYFGDDWVDEITSLSFQVIENVQPIYGYASYTYDAVARGIRQIQGQFSINFKESYYLHSIMNRLESKKREQEEAGYEFSSADYSKVNKGITVDQLLKASSTSDTSFEKYATMYERSLWGAETHEGMRHLVNKRITNSFFAPENKRPLIHKEGLSILIIYGPTPNMKNTYKNGIEDVSRTVHSLTGVQLTGLSHQIDSSGQPIQEIYSFIAQDVDWNINLKKNI